MTRPTRLSIDTRFGTFDVDQADIMTFPDGVPGFDRCRRFVLLSSAPFAPLQCLHAVDGVAASFLAVDPRLVMPGYQCALHPSDYECLRADDTTPLVWLALITVAEATEQASANLRAPIVVNPESMLGRQVISDDALLPVGYNLAA